MKTSEFGCVRFGGTSYSRLANDAGNQGCMSPDGHVWPLAHMAAEQSGEHYTHIILGHNNGQIPSEFVVVIQLLSQLVLMHALYVSAGRQVFQFTPGLIGEFKRTDISETPVGRLSLPYAAGFLHFGRQADLVLDEIGRTSPEQVDGAYYHCSPDGRLTVQFTLSRPHEAPSKLPGPAFSIKAENLGLPAHQAVDKAMEEYWGLDNQPPDNSALDAWHESGREWDATTRPVIHASLSLVLNALFYLDAYGADTGAVLPADIPAPLREAVEKAVRSGKPKAVRNARRELNAEGFTFVRMCGVDFDTQKAPGEGVEGSRHSVRTHWRRGHWRMQPCGPAYHSCAVPGSGRPWSGRIHPRQRDTCTTCCPTLPPVDFQTIHLSGRLS